MKKKLVAALLCGAMAAGSITVYAETVHAEGYCNGKSGLGV